MSAFYGEVEGMSSTSATRRGSKNSGIKVSAQSWDGSVITKMRQDEKGELEITIQLDDDSSFYGDTVFVGSMKKLRKVFELAKEIDWL